MEKMKMHSPNLVDENVRKIKDLFPNCVTEALQEDGTLKNVVDYDLLRQELSDCIVDGSHERYQLDWPGKRKALLAAHAPIAKAVRPQRDESVDFDNTQHLFIEGDNLEVLKLLQETYIGKVSMIYIDPPYNTGKDFIYSDKFSGSASDYLTETRQQDLSGKKLISNPESKGRFHSDWLSMMFSRLKLARNLLSEEGVIFISIDHNENHNLRKLTEEIFGGDNMLSELVWHLSSGPQAGHFTRSHESVIAFAKNKDALPYFKDTSGGTIKHGALKKISAVNPASEIVFPKGSIRCESSDIEFDDELGDSEKQYVVSGKLRFKDGLLQNDVTLEAGWAMKNQVISWLKGNETFDSKGQKVKRFYFNSQGILFYEKERGTFHPKTVVSSTDVGGTKAGGDEVKELFGNNVMSFPKPTGLIKFLIKLVCNRDGDIILDFFAGSATTADAVMQLNLEDQVKRKYIMIQLPEDLPKGSVAYKEGFSTISDIAKERIRRVGKRINRDTGLLAQTVDTGFRALKVDSSNMEDIYYNPDEMDQSKVDLFSENIKSDRTSEDLLFQVLIDWGVDLSFPIEHSRVQDLEVFKVDTNALFACFSKNKEVTEEFCRELAKEKPLRVVFRDAGFASDAVKINVEQIFKQLSPSTEVRTI